MSRQRNEESSCTNKRSYRISDAPYDNRTQCFFYGTLVDFNMKSARTSECVRVRTDTFAETIKQCCKNRCDEWSFIVLCRIEYFMSDLHAADCAYHQTCSVNFITRRNIPHQYQCAEEYKRAKVDRPKNELQRSAFLKSCDFLENNDEEQVTIGDLVSFMVECLASRMNGLYCIQQTVHESEAHRKL